MPAPNHPNTANANAKNRRRGDETAAGRLVRHGWLVIAPEVLARMDPELVALLGRVAAGDGRIHVLDLGRG